jgi:hypothetical protein
MQWWGTKKESLTARTVLTVEVASTGPQVCHECVTEPIVPMLAEIIGLDFLFHWKTLWFNWHEGVSESIEPIFIGITGIVLGLQWILLWLNLHALSTQESVTGHALSTQESVTGHSDWSGWLNLQTVLLHPLPNWQSAIPFDSDMLTWV